MQRAREGWSKISTCSSRSLIFYFTYFLKADLFIQGNTNSIECGPSHKGAPVFLKCYIEKHFKLCCLHFLNITDEYGASVKFQKTQWTYIKVVVLDRFLSSSSRSLSYFLLRSHSKFSVTEKIGLHLFGRV